MRALPLLPGVPAFRGRLRRITVIVGLLLALSFAAGAESARLGKDEGWLAVVVDNGIGATSVRIDGPGLSDGMANGLGAGRNLRLLKMRAGTYRWSMVNRPNWTKREWFTLDRSPAFEFRVEAGAVNYPGDLVMKPTGDRGALFYRVNRSLETALQIDTQEPGLRDALVWHQDPAHDPFMPFAAQALADGAAAKLAESAVADEKALRKTRVDPAFKRAFQEIFADAQVDWMEMSPSGDRVFFRERRGELQVLCVRDLASGKQIDLLATYGRFTGVSWGTDRLLHVAHGMARGTLIDVRKDETLPVLQGRGYRIVHLPEGELDAAKVSYVPLPESTWLVQPLRDSTRAVVGHVDSAGETHFFEIDETRTSFAASEFGRDQRLDKSIAQQDWSTLIFDPAGALGAGMFYDDNGRGAVAVRGTDGSWKHTAPPPFNTVLQPFAFTPDHGALVAFSDHQRDHVELVRVSLDGTIGETLLRASDTDLGDALVRPSDGLVIGAQRYRDGRYRPLYRDQANDARVQRAQREFPGRRAIVVDESSKARRALMLVFSATDRGSYYVFDEASSRFDRIADAYAKPTASTPSTTATLSVDAAGGRRLDGLVNLPAGAGSPPGVVVIPAGGALSAQAVDDYEATVQILNQEGYAVLRARYGGEGAVPWSRDAATDLEHLLDAAIGKFSLDRSRVAVLGAGQGGHAALMALIRAPQRFRCGIALGPVTDLPLAFTSDGWSRKPERVRAMQALVGDPSRDLTAMQENSPVYRYRELAQPLLLIHGTHDRSVSFEHSLRLRTLLAAAGRPPQWLPLRGGDQTYSRDADLLAIQVTSRQFLQQCLSAAASGTVR